MGLESSRGRVHEIHDTAVVRSGDVDDPGYCVRGHWDVTIVRDERHYRGGRSPGNDDQHARDVGEHFADLLDVDADYDD